MKHWRGFTLLEILILIIAIALVAVIAAPAFSRAREAGRRGVCQDNLKAIHMCLTMYEQTEGMFPVRPAPGKDQYSGDAQEALNLLYRQYTDDVRIFSCPSKPLSAAMLSQILPCTAKGWPNTPGTSFKQAAPGTEGMSTSYGYSPGHNSSQKRVVIMADRQGIGPKGNSDNHGNDAGQNILFAGGAALFANEKKNQIPKDDGGAEVTDSDIYADHTITPNTYFDWDSFCR
ncbi:MAG TPA: DUF1559 domain-containing protein [Planctomycetota bacterium]|nr:DUF1559 domain-containing protein [Planctomycetota bacterium]